MNKIKLNKKQFLIIIAGVIVLSTLIVIAYFISNVSTVGLGAAKVDSRNEYGQIVRNSSHILLVNFQSGDIFEFNTPTGSIKKLLNTGEKIASVDLDNSSNIVTISPLKDDKVMYKQYSLNASLVNTGELNLSKLKSVTLEPNPSIKLVRANIVVNKNILFSISEYNAKLNDLLTAISANDSTVMDTFLLQSEPHKDGFCSSDEYKDFKFTFTISNCLSKEKVATVFFTLSNSIDVDWNPWDVKLLDTVNNSAIIIQDRYSKDDKTHQQELFLASDNGQKRLVVESASEIVDAAFTSEGNVLVLLRNSDHLDWEIISK